MKDFFFLFDARMCFLVESAKYLLQDIQKKSLNLKSQRPGHFSSFEFRIFAIESTVRMAHMRVELENISEFTKVEFFVIFFLLLVSLPIFQLKLSNDPTASHEHEKKTCKYLKDLERFLFSMEKLTTSVN